MANLLSRLQPLRTVVLDIDGVLTNGQVFLLPDGTQMRSMNIKDGYALQLAVQMGYRLVVISGGASEESRLRLQKLGVEEVMLNVKNKVQALQTLGLAPQEVVFMGDDMPDLELLEQAGFAACPADACAEVRSACHYISPQRGGEGAVRDLLEKLLKLNGHWPLQPAVQSR